LDNSPTNQLVSLVADWSTRRLVSQLANGELFLYHRNTKLYVHAKPKRKTDPNSIDS